MTTGLVIFIVINVFNVLTLFYDLHLFVTGQETITNRIRGDMVLGIPIILVEFFMVGGLAAHLFNPTDLR